MRLVFSILCKEIWVGLVIQRKNISICINCRPVKNKKRVIYYLPQHHITVQSLKPGEDVKYFRNVYCVTTNHSKDQHIHKTKLAN